MKATLKRIAKAAAPELAYRRASAKAAAGALVGANPPVRRILLVSDGENLTSEQQFAPFHRHADALRKTLGLLVRQVKLARALTMSPAALGRYELVALKLGFRTSPEEVTRIAAHFDAALAQTRTPLVYFDGDDDSNIQWPQLLAASDLYVKKHMYSDRRDYGLARIGKSNLTDYVARTHGWSFADNEIPSSDPVAPELVDRIMVGWNIGLDDKIFDLAQRMAGRTGGPRPYDVCGRAVASPDHWIFHFRDPVARELEQLKGELEVLVPTGRVNQEEYYQEMLSSKICVSPFGYGELCWRDFEAILCGCLVIKPDMGHAETAPNIFVPHETYVPVKWDFSDLADACRRYAADDAARTRIVAQARKVLLDSLTPKWFVERVRMLLDRAKQTQG